MDITKKLTDISEKIDKIRGEMFKPLISIDEVLTDGGIRYKEVPYGHRQELLLDCSEWDMFTNSSLWGEPDGHVLFRFSVRIPEDMHDRKVFLFVSTGAFDIWNTDNPQMLVYVDGKRRSGMDMNHNSICIYDGSSENADASAEPVVDIGIYAYSNLAQNGNYLKLEIGALNKQALDTYFDLLVPFEAARAMLGFDTRKNAIDLLSDKKALSEVTVIDEKNADFILERIENACNMPPEEISEYLEENLYGKGENPATVACVGHTHIDVAWKWQIRQTREKVIRSYSTVMELMKNYPEYLFMASTPQMYEFVREEEPELYAEIQEMVRQGRFEVEGAMWLEADCNLTSGESLVRQILYGKKYMKESFGVDSDILWLPDVFGYSAAMPQILKKSGVRAFVTTKLAWNDTNRMPHDLFIWEGIDGSSIPTYIITTCDLPRADQVMREGGILNYTYNGRQDANQIMGTWCAFREKEITDEVLSCYGFGDGGGGPTWEMLEMDRRLRKGIPGVPKTVQKTVTGFFDTLFGDIEENDKWDKLPKWTDELYLEFHRGTYTSMGRNKKYNRQLEYLLKEAELLCTANMMVNDAEYPKERLLNIWKTVMLNQFHDILPGSSIEEVYKDSWEDYERAIAEVRAVIDEAYENLRTFDKLKNGTCCAEISSTKIQNADDKTDSKENPQDPSDTVTFATPYYRVTLDKNGEITSLFDIEANREIRDMSASPLNRLIAFTDKPREYDCWNIDADFEDESFDITDLSGMEVKEFDSRVEITIQRHFRNSTINQTICFYNDDRRIDFRTKADWHEHQVLLKAAFPVDIDTDRITCEIQYGSIQRNLKKDNSYDRAKFECCAHKWMDMSDAGTGYGVAVLNDCKYGYDAKEKLMRLTLIKSGIFPNPNADQGEHEFTYALLPHLGDYRDGQVIEKSEELNAEAHYYLGKENAADKVGFINSLQNSIISFGGEKGIFVESVKKAEDSDSVIIRIREGYGINHSVTAKLFDGIREVPAGVSECDLLENAMEHGSVDCSPAEQILKFELAPFEIKTFKA